MTVTKSSMTPWRRNVKHTDRGSTLTEVLIGIGLMGILVSALAVVATTVIRISPSAEDRNDDANSLLTLTAFMPEDVNSTPAGGFEFDRSLASGCAHTGNGVNLVRLSWAETTTETTTWIASYRYENPGNGYRILRYTCRAGRPAIVAEMTGKLPDIDESTWAPGDGPVDLQPHLDDDGAVDGLTVDIDTIAGDTFSFEMRTNNDAETLPPVAPFNQPNTPPTNQPPFAADVSGTTTQSTPITIGLPASDPDGDGLTVALASIPQDWATTTSGLTVTVTPHASWLPGDPNEQIDYTVTDPWGASTSAVIDLAIEVAPPPNQPPTAEHVVDTVEVGTDLVVVLPVTDLDGDPLTVTTSGISPHSGLDVQISGITLTISSDGSNLLPQTFSYTVSDGTDTATATVRLQIVHDPCNVTSFSPIFVSVAVTNNGYLSADVNIALTFTGLCNALVLAFDNNLFDGTYDPVYLSFAGGAGVTLQGGEGGMKWSPGVHIMALQEGEDGNPIVLGVIVVI